MLLQYHTMDVDHQKEEEYNYITRKLGGVKTWQDTQVHHADNAVEKE